MQLDALLEVAIGMVFVWLVLSVATMEIQNLFTAQQGLRAENLEKAILDMFKSPKLVEKFYNHPLILELSPRDKNGKYKRPDNIPNPAFVTAALEVILNAGKPGDTLPIGSLSISEMRASLNKLGDTNPALTRTLQHLLPNLDQEINNLENSVAGYRANIEAWFNNAMVQATNIYRQNAAKIALAIGLILAVIFNVDTINITQKLWQDPTIRDVLVAQAQNQSDINLSPSEIMAQAKELNFPVGWTTAPAQNQICGWIGIENYQLVIRSGGECRVLTSMPPLNNFPGVVFKLLGFLLSGAAASQGAPFWFDILKKLVSLRTTTQTTTTTSTPATTNTSTPATTTTSTQTTTTAPAQTTTNPPAQPPTPSIPSMPPQSPPPSNDTPPPFEPDAVG